MPLRGVTECGVDGFGVGDGRAGAEGRDVGGELCDLLGVELHVLGDGLWS